MFSCDGEFLPDSFISSLEPPEETNQCILDSIASVFDLPENISQLCRNPRELALLQTIAEEGKKVNSLVSRILDESCCLDSNALNALLCELQGHINSLQQQKPTLALFAETNTTTADELATVSVCYSAIRMSHFSKITTVTRYTEYTF